MLRNKTFYRQSDQLMEKIYIKAPKDLKMFVRVRYYFIDLGLKRANKKLLSGKEMKGRENI